MIYKITSKQNDRVKEAVKLFDSSERNKRQQFIVEGYHLLEMAIDNKCVLSIFTIKEIPNIDSNIPQYLVSEDILKKLSSTKNPQGVVAVCSMAKPLPVKGDKVLYLDGIADPGNMGTLFRTALAFGYKDIILDNTVSMYNDKVISSSQGAIFKLNIVSGDISTLKSLKDYEILATEIKGSIPLEEVKPHNKHVLILGNEARGVRPEILEIAHKRIRIDIKEIESLNVGVAGAICMYALNK